ncbi:MAG TPA: hypothetical protein DEF03_04910 [Bacteroidetes bacterium]|nr:hypothetical protein [Bacteroidota bacterium]|tara:strand:- start:848 stop:1288 length:441 start_codon:yes stop_codon:yes gene_type:complete
MNLRRQTLNFKINEVGSSTLHERHKIDLRQVPETQFLQAKVKDQLFIDHLLLEDLIDVKQHQNGEYIQSLASGAGCFATAPSFGGAYSPTTQPKNPLTQPLVRLSSKIRHIRRKYGDIGVNVVTAHVVLDKWTEDKTRINILAKVL